MSYKSPITGKEMVLCNEPLILKFRNESFLIDYHYYKCEDSDQQYTTTHLDELNINQVYKQYNERFGDLSNEINCVKQLTILENESKEPIETYYSCEDCSWSGVGTECETEYELDGLGNDYPYPICPKCSGNLNY